MEHDWVGWNSSTEDSAMKNSSLLSAIKCTAFRSRLLPGYCFHNVSSCAKTRAFEITPPSRYVWDMRSPWKQLCLVMLHLYSVENRHRWQLVTWSNSTLWPLKHIHYPVVTHWPLQTGTILAINIRFSAGTQQYQWNWTTTKLRFVLFKIEAKLGSLWRTGWISTVMWFCKLSRANLFIYFIYLFFNYF